MTAFKNWGPVALSVLAALFFFDACKTVVAPPQVVIEKPEPRVLVFTRTKGFYHNSIPAGAAALHRLGVENNFRVDTTSDPAYFKDDSLKNYSAVVFLSTTMNVLDADQQVAFERYIQAGGGYAGIHAATDTEYDWPWYNRLVGAYFLSHPRNQKATIRVIDKNHPSTSFLPDKWERFDEWYNFKNIQPGIKVLALLDESTYEGGTNGDNHPIAWYHDFDGGRAFYTGGGHTIESYSEPLFLQHLLGGLRYAIGDNKPLDYAKAYSVKSPEDNRFTKTVLTNDLNEPMELAVAPDGRVFFTERSGKFYVYEPAQKRTRLLHDFPAKAVDKYLNGLIGVTLDPAFDRNRFIYFFYSSNTGAQYHQNISRFLISSDGNLDTTSEKIIIKVPIDLEVSAHTGGSLAWDRYGNLYISTGDNTVPFESDGYAPLDERPGRIVYDAQRSAANPADLRGKILRIHPEPDGSYTIPEGNLFPKGTPGTRPEIYVMGCRNPYRIAVDPETSFVYWGEVGPDAGRDSRHGPRGYDEFNQARGPGNFGWPYFVGNSQAYHDSDFATRQIGDLFNPQAPANPSPNNTGMKQLPPATDPLIWYPYNRSEEFPELGDGGRCAMGGPVYHFDAGLQSSIKLPAYYHKAWFVYDWMRNWVFAVRMDTNYQFKRLEPFMYTNGDFRRPVDMEIGPDGAIYMLEYGSVYGIDNVDARLVRIDYNAGNRAPVAKISARDTIGIAPLKVSFSSRESFDHDEKDRLRYEWRVNSEVISSEANPAYTFTGNGIYRTVLRITDESGSSSSDTLDIKVGNTLPLVDIRTEDNTTFFFEKPTGLQYSVVVSDKEDPAIDRKNLKVQLTFIPKVASTQAVMGHQQLDENYSLGRNLVAASDCKACHQMNAKSVGPSFMQVSQKYGSDKNATGYLANKIITGGGGVWGEHAMNAHPQISKEDATEIVKYVLSVSNEKEERMLPANGTVTLQDHIGVASEGRYFLTAAYTDKGGALVPLTAKKTLVLRPSKIQAQDADQHYMVQKGEQGISNLQNRSYFVLRNIDLKDITGVTYRYASASRGATVQLRLDSLKGPLISTVDYAPTGARDKFAEITAPVQAGKGMHHLYFLVVKPDTPNTRLGTIDWVRFEGGREVVPAKKAVPKMVQTEKAKPAPPSATTKTNMVSVIHSGKALIAKSDCISCHAIREQKIGPSYVAVAKKYPTSGATVSRLADKVIRGGSGAWGKLPMTPHPKLSRKDATAMVQYILSLDAP